jgi:hypothetical protein
VRRRAQIQVHAPALLVPPRLLDLSPRRSVLGALVEHVDLSERVQADCRERALRVRDRFCPPFGLGEISFSLWFMRLPT